MMLPVHVQIAQSDQQGFLFLFCSLSESVENIYTGSYYITICSKCYVSAHLKVFKICTLCPRKVSQVFLSTVTFKIVRQFPANLASNCSSWC